MPTGRLLRWNESKGFGFISAPDRAGDVFLHATALRRTGMPRPPRVGETIHYDLHHDNDGKRRAVNARIEGLDPAPRAPDPQARPARAGARGQRPGSRPSSRRSATRTSGRKRFNGAILLVLMIVTAVFAYQRLQPIWSPTATPEERLPAPSETRRPKKPRFSCQGKVHCSEMNSCAEAKFYIRNCPNTRMDGDGDGVPCERQWCGGR
jgi:cold shock CspA family protein